MGKISIIIPMYNSEKYIYKCLNSVLEQTYKDLEIILINDGSIDNTTLICEEFTRKYKNVILINQNNKGVASARNTALRVATGKYIGFIDSDDYIDLNMYEVLLNAMNQSSEIDIVSCRFYESKELKGISRKLELSNEEVIKECCGELLGGYVCNKLFKAEIIKNNNIMFREDIHISEDYLFCLDYIACCNKGILCNEKLYHYVYRGDSVTKEGFTVKRLSGLKAYDLLLKHKCITVNPTIASKVRNDYVKYCLWLSKAIISSSYEFKDKYVNELKERIDVFKYDFMRNNKVSIKYKIGVLILYICPNIFKLIK